MIPGPPPLTTAHFVVAVAAFTVLCAALVGLGYGIAVLLELLWEHVVCEAVVCR